MVLVGVTARLLVTARSWFYWDDLTLHSQARQFDTPSLELLLRNHDGHLMPGSWLIEWLLATYAPLNWTAAVVVFGILQVAAAIAVAWACQVICRRLLTVRRIAVPLAVVPLVLYLVTPLTLPTTTWLATALNILPLHLAFAMVLGHAVLALRTGLLRHQFIAAGWLLFGMLFSERALFLGPVAVLTMLCFALAAGSLRASGRRIGQLAVVLAVPTIIWSVVYLSVIGDPREASAPDPSLSGQGASVWSLLSHGYLQGLLPTLGGGPWHWERWHPGPPWSSPTFLAVLAGVLALLAVAVWTARRGVRALLAWLPALLYPLAPLIALGVGRTGPETAAELAQTLRHFSEVAVLLAVALAFVAGLTAPRPAPRAERLLVPVVLVALVLSSAVSVTTYARIWADQPARDYFANLRSDLAERSEPIFDQAVSLEVLLPVVHPHNQLSNLIGGLEEVPPIEPHTTDPVFVGDSGNLRPATLAPLRSTVPGGEPGCGTRADEGGATLQVDGPLLDREWVVLLNYFADADGAATLRLDGEPVKVPVSAGLNQVYVQVPGGGTELSVTPEDGTSEMCLGSSDIGVLSPAG